MHANVLVATLGFVATSSTTFIAAANSIVMASTNVFKFAVSANNLDVQQVVVNTHNTWALAGRTALIDVHALTTLPGYCYGTKMDEMCQVSVIATMTRVGGLVGP
jgi:hypothetical protein